MLELPFLIVGHIWRWWRQARDQGSYGRIAPVGRDSTNHSPEWNLQRFRDGVLQKLQTCGYDAVINETPRANREAMLMAKTIFRFLCAQDRKYFVEDDFVPIFPDVDIGKRAFFVFDIDRDGTVTKLEFRDAIVRIFQEQRNLSKSLASTGSALAFLDTINTLVVSIGLTMVLLSVFGVSLQPIFATVALLTLGMNFFIFDAANKTFNALLFLFVIHPYDIGDRIVIGSNVGHSDEDILRVMHINIHNTVFRRWNGLPVVVPNHLLAAGTLANLSRSDEQWERVEFELLAPDGKKLSVEEETSRLAELRNQIDRFVRQYPQDYYQAFELRAVIAADNARADSDLNTLKFVLKIRCKETSKSQKKWIRHARILAFVKQAIRFSGVGLATAESEES